MPVYWSHKLTWGYLIEGKSQLFFLDSVAYLIFKNVNAVLINKLLATFFLLVSCAIEAGTLQGKVIGVADGDSLTVLDNNKTQHKIRLQGIDAPEKVQAFGQKSKQALHQLAHNKQVTVEFQKKDKYGRTVGKVLVNGNDICLEQIKLGMAWHYTQYATEQPKEDRIAYQQAELAARGQALGIWKDQNAIPPWEFRKQTKN